MLREEDIAIELRCQQFHCKCYMRDLNGERSVLLFESKQETNKVSCPHCQSKVYLEFAPQLPQNQAIADNRSIEQRICIKPAKRSRQRDLSLLVRFMQRRATPITQKDVSRR